MDEMRTNAMSSGVKLAIIGSRGLVVDVGKYISCVPACIISGGARGVDTCAAEYAAAHNIPLRVFRPDYAAHRQGAPIRRNEIIARECTEMLAFWDGKSKGTKYTIEYARKLKKVVHVINGC